MNRRNEIFFSSLGSCSGNCGVDIGQTTSSKTKSDKNLSNITFSHQNPLLIDGRYLDMPCMFDSVSVSSENECVREEQSVTENDVKPASLDQEKGSSTSVEMGIEVDEDVKEKLEKELKKNESAQPMEEEEEEEEAENKLRMNCDDSIAGGSNCRSLQLLSELELHPRLSESASYTSNPKSRAELDESLLSQSSESVPGTRARRSLAELDGLGTLESEPAELPLTAADPAKKKSNIKLRIAIVILTALAAAIATGLLVFRYKSLNYNTSAEATSIQNEPLLKWSPQQDFNGLYDYVDITDDLKEVANFSEGTIFARFRFNSSTAIGSQTIFSASCKNQPSSELHITIGYGGITGSISYVVRFNGKHLVQLASQRPINDNKWHTAAVVTKAVRDKNYSGSEDESGSSNVGTTLYVDGSIVSSSPSQNVFFSSLPCLDNMNIGRNVASGWNQWYFDGNIETVSVFNYSLSSTEIEYLR